MLDEKKWHIWYKQYDEEGNEIESGVYSKEYVNYGNAVRVAEKIYGDRPDIKCVVAVRDPWQVYTRDAVCDICGSGFSRLETNEGYPICDRISIFGLTEMDPLHRFAGALYPKHKLSVDYKPCPECITRVYDFIKNLRGGAADVSND